MRGVKSVPLESASSRLSPTSKATFYREYERETLAELRASGRLLGAYSADGVARPWKDSVTDALLGAPIIGARLANSAFGRRMLLPRELADADRLLVSSADETLREAMVIIGQRRILRMQERHRSAPDHIGTCRPGP